MVAGVSSTTTVLNASSPLVVPDSKQTTLAAKTEATPLTLPPNTGGLADIANAFAPPAQLSRLAPSNTSVLLTAQAREKPVILSQTSQQLPQPKPQPKSPGTLDIYKDLILQANTARIKDNAPTQAHATSLLDTKPAPKPQQHHETFTFIGSHSSGTAAEPPSHTAQAFKETIKAFDDAQAVQAAIPDAQKPQYITSTVNISV